MGRVYLPIWCELDNCKECDIDRCNKRILDLFEPYRDVDIWFKKRPKQIEITTTAIYLGYCQVLGKFCLQFPQYSLAVVRNSFSNSEAGLPTNQPIQRIFLDMLNRGDPKAPTDAVHRYRLVFFSDLVGARESRIGYDGQIKKNSFSEKEIKEAISAMKRWREALLSGKLTFKRTENPLKCRYCILDDCEKI